MLARVHAGAVHSLYGYLGWLAQQMMPDTAESVFLDRFAGIWGVLRVPAAFAAGDVTLTGNAGAVAPAGTVLRRADGATYTLSADATLTFGTAIVEVAATEAGAAGNATVGTSLQLVQPIGGINSAAVVASGGLSQGADAETDDALRVRLLARFQQPPMGGSASDYVAWALQVPGVTRAWVYPLEGGPGTVSVRFVRDGDASMIPDAGEVASVQAYIDAKRPVTAQVTVVAPVAVALNMSITLTPSTVAVKAAVEAELADLIQREGKPGGTLLVSHLREAISVAAGETNHVLTVPSADVTHTTNQIPVLGTITWT